MGEKIRCGNCGRVIWDKSKEPCGTCLAIESEISLNCSGFL